MSLNASKELVDLIDSRITAKKFQRVAVVESVSEDNKKAVVRFPETDTTFEYFNKTAEVLDVGDSVYVASNDGDLMNGYIQNRFGESSWLIPGENVGIGKGSVGGDELADGAVDTGHIADGAIIGTKIADFTVDNAKIGFAAIDTANIRDATITTAKIGDATITTAKIHDAAITNAKIENLAVTTAKIQDAAITNAKIENLAVDNAKIAIAAIDTANIKDLAVKTACIDLEAVGTSQIADGSITDAKVVSLTADKLTAGTIDAGTIDVVNLRAASITVGQINGVQIEDGAIGLAKLDALVNDKITTAQTTADKKNTIYYGIEPPTGTGIKTNDTWFDTDDGYKIYNYNGTEWVATAFGSNAIDDSAVTGAKLSDGSITGVKLVDGTVTAREIATGAITANELAANSVTANAIEAKSVNASHIETNTITADKLLLGDSTSYSTIDMLLYVSDDWTDWTNIVVSEITQDSNKFIKTAQTTDTDLLFSLPYSSSILAANAADNEFGFSFTISNDSGMDKTVILSAYFFDSTKKFLSKATIDTLSLLSTETFKKIESIKTFASALNSKYFCFGISIADGFNCGIKSIQIRKTMGTTFISDGAITTGKIVANAITAAKIASKTITANEIVSNTITSNEIAAGAITADKIAANAITSAKIKSGEITTDHVNSNFGETLDISSNESITLMVNQLVNKADADDLATVNTALTDIQTQLDGKIDTYYTDTDPSLSWLDADRPIHTGDMWYLKTEKLLKRYDGSTNTWALIQDKTALDAYAAASNAQDTADEKRRIFTVQPTPPYDVGDLWAGGTSSDLMRCIVARADGSYNAADWEKAMKAIDTSFIEETLEDIQTQLDGKIDTYYTDTDPETSWTSEDKPKHVGDMWYQKTNKILKRYGGDTEKWVLIEDKKAIDAYEAASNAQDTADGKRQVFTATPVPPYDVGDLWTSDVGSAAANLMRCIVARADGSYNAADWEAVYNGNAIRSLINQTSTTVLIEASKINLSGYTTFSNLSTSGQTTINGANITTGTISASRLDLSGYATFTSLSTAGSTTINGSNITTGTISASRINMTGALNGYSSGNSTGLSINSSGLITIPTSSSVMFGTGATLTALTQGSGGFTLNSSSTDISINPGASYYSKIYNLNATSQPYNIPMTTTSSSTKITQIAHFSTYLNVTCNNTNYGVTYNVSDRRLKKNIFDSDTSALSKILSVKIRRFDWILNGKHNECGFIAQEIEEDIGSDYVLKVPQPDGTISYQIQAYEFIPLLTKGVQELSKELMNANNEITILKAKSDYYESAIHEMRLEIENLKNGMVA